ncbi:MAG: FAD-dependent monooxygenase, partial [Streptosporangiaceae bacterium]
LRLMGQVSTPRGVYSLGPQAFLDSSAPRGAYIVSTVEEDPSADLSAPMTLDELRGSFRRVLGADLPMSDPQLLTRTVGNSRQADRYRARRIFIAGDAAHVFGLGGSLNTGLLDAVNLGWKLAAAVRDRAAEHLLDTYHAERHLAGQRAVLQSRAQKALTVLGQGGDRQPSAEGAEALRELFGDAADRPDPLGQISDLLKQPDEIRRIGELMEGSDVRYPMPGAGDPLHPLVGKLAPDLPLEAGDGRTRVAELTRTGQSVLLGLTDGAPVAAAASGWSHARLSVITARCLTRPAPAAALFIRPDGYVAWAAASGASDPAAGLEEALRRWLGALPPAAGQDNPEEYA